MGIRQAFVALLMCAPFSGFAECVCQYNYGDHLVTPQVVTSAEACKEHVGNDLAHRYLDKEICVGSNQIEVGWSCGDRLSSSRDHRCEDLGLGIIREQLSEVQSESFRLSPKVECEDESYRLRPLTPVGEVEDDSRESFRIKPWKQGVKVRYRVSF